MPTLSIDRAGTYDLQLVVNDGTLSSTPDTVRISTLNSRPIANAGPDQTTTVSGTVRLDGTLSSDPDGDPLTFAWSFQSVPGGSTPHFRMPSVSRRALSPTDSASYVVQLSSSMGALEHRRHRESLDPQFGCGSQCRDESNSPSSETPSP